MLRFLSFLFILIPALAVAQSPGKRTCRILFLGAPDNAPEKLQLFDGTSSQEVALPRMNLSPVYELPGGPLVVRLLEAAPPKPDQVSPDAPKATVPETMMDLFLIVTSDLSNGIAPVRLQVIDGDSSKFKRGEMLWYNLTTLIIGGKVGSEQLALAANSRTIMKAPASGDVEYPVSLAYRKPDDEKLYPLCETKWTHDPRLRTLIFVVIQSDSRVPRVMGFQDYREPDKKEN